VELKLLVDPSYAMPLVANPAARAKPAPNGALGSVDSKLAGGVRHYRSKPTSG